MMEGRLLSVAITGEARGRLSDCATCGNQEGNIEQSLNWSVACETDILMAGVIMCVVVMHLPYVFYLVSHCECQRCTSDSGAVGYRSQHQAALAQQLTGEGLQDRGCWLHGFGGCSGGGWVGGRLRVKLRRYHSEGLRHRGDCTVEHFLPGFFHLSQKERTFYGHHVMTSNRPHFV